MPKRPVHIPLYALLVLVLAAVSGPPLSIYASVQIAETRANALVERYERDQAANAALVAAEKAKQAEESRRLSCALFSAQIEAFDTAVTSAGKASLQAWEDLYKLAKCQPSRK
jgi:hypothetical protein